MATVVFTAIGTVCNLAARLCAEAKDGQILVSSRVARAAEAVAILEDLGNLELRGLRRPVAAFNVVQSTSAPDARSGASPDAERVLPTPFARGRAHSSNHHATAASMNPTAKKSRLVQTSAITASDP